MIGFSFIRRDGESTYLFRMRALAILEARRDVKLPDDLDEWLMQGVDDTVNRLQVIFEETPGYTGPAYVETMFVDDRAAYAWI